MIVDIRIAKVAIFLVWIVLSQSLRAQPPAGRLAELFSAANRSMQAGDREATEQAVEQILKLCGAASGTSNPKDSKIDEALFRPSDPARIQFLIAAAQIDFDWGPRQRAIDTLQLAARDAIEGTTEQVTALAYLVRVDVLAGKPDLDRAIRALSASSSLMESNRDLYDDVQSIVIDAVAFARLPKIAAGDDTAKHKHDQIENNFGDLQEAMVTGGVPVGVARLTLLALADFSLESGLDAHLEDLLQDLRPVIEDQAVNAQWRAKYWNLATQLHLKRRHFAEAFDAAHAFLKYAKLTRRADLPVIANDQLALIALQLGDYSEARQLLERSRDFHLHHNDLRQTIDWRINYANAIAGDRDFIIARNALRETHESLQDKLEQYPLSAANVANNLGINHYLTGEFDEAERLVEFAAKIYRQKLDPADLAIGETSMINPGWIALARDDLEQAADLFAKAADHFATHYSTSHPRYAESLSYQARAGAAAGDLVSAREWIVEAEQTVYESVCGKLCDSPSARDRLALVQEARVHPESIAFPGTTDAFLELAPKLGIPPQQQYEVVLRWKGLTGRFDRLYREAIDPATVNEEREILQKLHEAYFRSVSALRRRALQQEVSELENRLRQIRRSRVNRIDPDAEAEPTVAAVAKRLSRNELLLDIFQYRTFQRPTKGGRIGSSSEYLAFLIDHTGRVQRLSFGAVDDVDAAIVRWRKTITERLRDEAEAAATVAKFVQEPLLSSGISFERLKIRADATCHLIPWAALPGTGGKRYWIENVTIELINDVINAGEPNERGDDHPKSLLVTGGVDYGPLAKQWPPLPGTIAEAKAVEALFRNQFRGASVTTLTGTQADEASLIKAMSKVDYVHLATHGFFRRENEGDAFALSGETELLSTGLVVAPSVDPVVPRDQYLTAAEIGELDLSRCSLVMLSACESGLGRMRAGQGIAGMFGSFHTAGAQKVIGTLWKVDDEATAKLTKRFYEHHWRDGMSVNDALRKAQLWMLDHPKEAMGNELLRGTRQPTKDESFDRLPPAYWAAFVLSTNGW